MNTPGSLSAQAQVYRRLGQYLSAGIPVVQALESLQHSPPNLPTRRLVGHLLASTRSGGSMAEGFRAARRWVPELDATLVEACERSGRLDSGFARLAENYEEQARQLRSTLLGLLYPLLIVHVAMLLVPLPALVLSWDVLAYLRTLLLLLGPVYGLGWLLGWIFLGRHGPTWRAVADSLLAAVPMVGRARRSLTLARLAGTLDTLLNAGVGVLEAWPLAAEASGSSAIQRRVAGWRPRLDAGETPGELLARSPEFPEHFATHYRTGEFSGSLDASLTHLREFYLEEGNRLMRIVSRALPFLFYLLVMLVVAIYVLHSWMKYYLGVFQQLGL